MKAFKASFSGSADITEYLIIVNQLTSKVISEITNPAHVGGSTFSLIDTLHCPPESAHEYMDEGEWTEISDDMANYVLFRAGQPYDMPYSLQDSSSSPYAWAMDGASPEALESHLNDGGSEDEWANSYARAAVEGAYSGDLSTKQVMDILDDAGELHEFVEFVIEYAAEHIPSFPSLTQRILAAPVVEALEVTRDMLEGLEEDGGIVPSFDDNGGEPDGTVLLTTDYTMAQRDLLIERGATIRRVAKLSYLWRDACVMKATEAYKGELEASAFQWCAMQVAGEALVVMPAHIEEVSVPPQAMSKKFSTFREALSTMRWVSESINQSSGNVYFGTLSELASALATQADETPYAACYVGANGFRYVTSGNLEYGIVRDGEQYVAFVNHPRQWHFFSTLFANTWLAGFRGVGVIFYDDYTARAVLTVASLRFDAGHTLLGEDEAAARQLVAHIAGVLRTAKDAYSAKVEALKREQEAEEAAKYTDEDDEDEKFLGTSTLAKIRAEKLFAPTDDE